MMNVLQLLDPGSVVGTAILGAVWQALFVVVLAAVVARAGFRHRPDARHALWLGALFCVLLSPVTAALLGRFGLVLWRVALPVSQPRAAAAVFDYVEPAGIGERFDARPISGGIPPDVIANRAGLIRDTRAERPSDERHRAIVEGGALRAKPRGNVLAGGLILLWATGVLVGFIRIGWGWWQLRALSRAARPLEIARHGASLEWVRSALRLPALPPIEISAAARGPVAAGLFRPRIVLPDGMAELISESALRDVIVHECAHVFRRDAWVGLLQRVGSALFWPHPCIHYLNGQLTRACEEVCDNHVLRFGDPCGYARTLVELTALCRPPGVTRPGIGLLTARWTLSDRVAGLLDPGRSMMTRASVRMKVVLAVLLGVAVLSGTSVQVGGGPPVEQQKAAQAVPKIAAPPTANSDFWDVNGMVVDEQGRPVAGAVVRTMPVFDGRASVEVQTGADGSFHFTLTLQNPVGPVGLMALADGGARMGLDATFDQRRVRQTKEPARIVVKPSRAVTVRVKDATGAAVPGATVEAAERRFRMNAMTDTLGTVTLRIPADANIQWVLALRSGVGLDYFENYEKRGVDATGPLPAEIVLGLKAARVVRIKVVDSKGQPVAGVGFKPGRLGVPGKKDSLGATSCATLRGVSDAQGVASFDWFPAGPTGARFSVDPQAGYSCLDLLEDASAADPLELAARVLRATRIGGTVRLPDGRPAPQVLVKAAGWGSDAAPVGMRTARTGENGRYELDVPPEQAYMVAVVDDTWAARSFSNVIVREGQLQDKLNFALIKGTLLRGQVTGEPVGRIPDGTTVLLLEHGGLLPKEFRGVIADKAELSRATTIIGADGRFQFRVGPGTYTLQVGTTQSQRVESPKVSVIDESELVHDLTLKLSPPETTFKGVVVVNTPTGERGVAKARIVVSPLGPHAMADDQGRFEIRRKPGPIVFFAYSEEQGLGGFAVVSADAASSKLLISKSASLSGRIVDTDGKPQAKHRVGIRLRPRQDYVSQFLIVFQCDQEGRFAFKCAPIASEGELSAPHSKDSSGRATYARTVMPFEVDGLETVEVPDLVVPAEKGARP